MRRLATVAPLCLLSVLLVGCSEGTAPQDETASTLPPAAPSEGGSPSEEPEAVADTYADVEPATQALDAGLVDGVEAFAVWADAVPEETPGQLGGGTTTADGDTVAVVLNVNDGLLALEDAEAEMRYFKRRNTTTEGPIQDLDPVVVDGEEMLRARGASINDLDLDFFVHATGELTVEVTFLTPSSLSEAEREDWIGQVMTTLEFG